MYQGVKVLATKPDNLSSMPTIPMLARGELASESCPLSSIICCGIRG